MGNVCDVPSNTGPQASKAKGVLCCGGLVGEQKTLSNEYGRGCGNRRWLGDAWVVARHKWHT